MTRSGFRRAAADERGATLFIVAIAMFALLMLSAFVVDVANFYVHKRHLQLEADAAALAGAQAYVVGNCSDGLINTSTRTYGGSASDGTNVFTGPPVYNDQLGGTPHRNMYLLINSAGYWGDSGTYGNNTDPNGSPCTAKYVDVKITETNLPWFFGFGGIVRRINAHARVGIVQQGQTNGTLPIAVPNPLPNSAAAIFIDETTNPVTVVGAVKLCSHPGISNGLDIWSNVTCPKQITIPSRATGVVIALSGRSPADLAIGDNMTLTAMCQQSLTDCYDAGSDPPTNGVSFIRGYSGVGSGTQPNPPILRSVELFPGTCPNIAYFSANTSTCNFELVARIDAGAGALPKANQIYTANGVALDSSTDPNCAFVAGADQCWHANLSLPASSGPDPITITWEETTGQVNIGGKLETCTDKGGNKCTGTFDAPAQRAYSAVSPSNGGPSSGPIKLVDLCNKGTDPSCATSDSQSYLVGSQQTFVVTIGIGGTLQNATSTNDPLVSLRLRSAQSNQALDCDPGYTNLKTELAKGCRPSYIPNAGTPDCATLGTSALWATPQPWSCVAVQQGVAQNDVAAGMNQRIFGVTNPPNTAPQCVGVPTGLGHNGYNNWGMYDPNYRPTGVTDPTYGVIRGQDGFPLGDPRVLDAFITTYGAFSHVNGTSGSVPIITFGHFYVTGYTANGGGFQPPTNCGMDPVPNNDPGVIVGHFIRYTDFSGGTGTQPCDPNSISACTIVMTK